MLDDFRRQAADSTFDEEESKPLPPRRVPGRFLGLTPSQMFVVSLLLLIITCLAGSFCLLATGTVVPPNF